MCKLKLKLTAKTNMSQLFKLKMGCFIRLSFRTARISLAIRPVKLYKTFQKCKRLVKNNKKNKVPTGVVAIFALCAYLSIASAMKKTYCFMLLILSD